MRRRSVVLSFIVLNAAFAASEYYPPPDASGGWRSLTSEGDEALRKIGGMNRAKLDEAFDLASTPKSSRKSICPRRFRSTIRRKRISL